MSAAATLEEPVAAISSAEPVWKPKYNHWLVGVVVSIAAFMEVLDTSIANVALPHIAGNMGATNSDSTWVLTSYLAANAIVLPVTGWLTQLFGRKRFFLICIVMFTASSFLCGIAPSLGILLLARVLQGGFGGGLQPMAQAIMKDAFPPDQQGHAFALYGISAIVGPAVGPVLGGWLTDNYSWRWIFYINIPMGLLALVLVSQLVEDPPGSRKKNVSLASLDYLGFGFLAIGIAALQIVLDKGQEDDWFGSHFIVALSIIAVVCLTALIIWEYRQKHPVVDVHLFKDWHFSACNVMMFVLGIVIYGCAVLLPQMLQTLMGYTAMVAGFVMSGGAICLILCFPIAGKLTNKYPAKYIMACGWICMTLGLCFSFTGADLQMSFGAASKLRIVQYVPISILFVPLTVVSYVGLPSNKNNEAAGLLAFMRNIGGSVGTSIVTTVLARRAQFHQSILVQHTRSTQARAAIKGLALHLNRAGIGHCDAPKRAVAGVARMIEAQSYMLSYLDCYFVFAVTTAAMLVISLCIKKNKPGAGGPPPAH
jgi:DHA2 family multidrug resistance protein